MDPSNLNLRQLRVELKKRGLSPSGLKIELIERMRKALSVDGAEPLTAPPTMSVEVDAETNNGGEGLEVKSEGSTETVIPKEPVKTNKRKIGIASHKKIVHHFPSNFYEKKSKDDDYGTMK